MRNKQVENMSKNKILSLPADAGKKLKGTKVRFNVIRKDSKDEFYFEEHTGHIESSNATGTGYVICGETITGIYNRELSDIVILEEETQVEVQFDFVDRRHLVVA